MTKTEIFLRKHSSTILTCLGSAGVVATAVLAVKATPKALQLIEEAKQEKQDELSTIETIKVAWKPYIPAAALGLASITCIIGASAVNYKRNAALATAYAISERTLIKYRDKVIETIGEKKEKEIKEKIAQDGVDNKRVSDSQVIITSKGNTLFMDGVSGRYFRSDLDKINKVVNELNRRMTYENYISLDDFYTELGLDSTSNSSYLGWNLDDGLIALDISTCLADNDEPCIVIDYKVAPRYEFDKLM